MKIELINANPQMHFAIQLSEEEINKWYLFQREVCKVIDYFSKEIMKIDDDFFVFRGVDYIGLDTIIRTGIDVIPSDSAIFTAHDPCKAIEYGWDYLNKRMVLMMLKSNYIKKSFTIIPVDTSETTLEELKKTYPNVEHLVEESKIYLSKLALDDPRRNVGYEHAYGGYIPGNPLEALKAVFYIGNISDEMIQEIKLKTNTKV